MKNTVNEYAINSRYTYKYIEYICIMYKYEGISQNHCRLKPPKRAVVTTHY